MKLKKLDFSFYQENKHLKEALDLVEGEWTPNKQRGHGIVEIKFNNLVFAIPLRSWINHKSCCLTTATGGLDFSKALLIEKKEYISTEDFKIPSKEFLVLQKKEITIAKRFGKYVTRYIKARGNRDRNILLSPEYRYSTLQNYDEALLSENEE